MQTNTWYYEKWGGRQASFYRIWSVKHLGPICLLHLCLIHDAKLRSRKGLFADKLDQMINKKVQIRHYYCVIMLQRIH